jgi:hypothetical protein
MEKNQSVKRRNGEGAKRKFVLYIRAERVWQNLIQGNGTNSLAVCVLWIVSAWANG